MSFPGGGSRDTYRLDQSNTRSPRPLKTANPIRAYRKAGEAEVGRHWRNRSTMRTKYSAGKVATNSINDISPLATQNVPRKFDMVMIF